MSVCDWEKVNDFGHYELDGTVQCLYPNVKDMLKQELSSNEDFDTWFHGFKNSFETMRLIANSDKILLTVTLEMDEIENLVDDLNIDFISDDVRNQLIEFMINDDSFVTETLASMEIDRNSSLEYIIEKATMLSAKNEEVLNNCFSTLVKKTEEIFNL